jgi:hypothetical protein
VLWDIWAEGFMFSLDERAQASLVGKAEGATFRDACINWYKEHPTTNFNPETLSDWGCRLFPTEAEARRSFG